MPFSSENGKSYIKRIFNKVPNINCLDIGCGSGTYAKMFPNSQWDGVEVWEPYVKEYGLEGLYNNLYVKDARQWTPQRDYDVAILGDVLEHMTVGEAKVLFDKVKRCAETVIVSIPIGLYPQREYEGNPFEAHVKDDWTDEQVKDVFGCPSWSIIDGEIGVYVWTPHDVRLKICVYAIAKNEAHFVPRFMNGAKGADLVLIADTGSTDGLPHVARDIGAQVYDIHISPWRFDLARNAALALIPKDYDVCISLDIDEVLQEGWRTEIERVWRPETTRLRYMFDWGCGIQFKYEKIHARHGYRWHHPCHEYPVPDGRIQEVWADTDMLLAVHMPDPNKSRGQYLDLLELSVKEDPLCPRNAFYYARELSFHGKYEESIEALQKYLSMPQATWPNERCYAMRTMARCYSELGNLYDAEKWCYLACAEAPNTREPWCELAMLLYRQQKWPECFAASMRALQVTDMQKVYTCDPAVWGHWPHDLASISAWQLGMHSVALHQARLACEKSPNDQRLQSNLELIQSYLLKEVA